MVQFTVGGMRGQKLHFPHHDVFHKDVVLAAKTKDEVRKLLSCRFTVKGKKKTQVVTSYLMCPRASSGRKGSFLT